MMLSVSMCSLVLFCSFVTISNGGLLAPEIAAEVQGRSSYVDAYLRRAKKMPGVKETGSDTVADLEVVVEAMG